MVRRYRADVACLALLPSPLLGDAVWRPVASVLIELGWNAEAVQLAGPAPTNVQDATDSYLEALRNDEAYVLVPHSNAGLYVPALAEQRRVEAVVFVDASVPPVEGGFVPTLPAEFRDAVAAKADDQGKLPVWTAWWDEPEMASLFPDEATRFAVERQQRRLPLAYFEDAVRVAPGWDDRPCAYLAFGDGYASEAAKAREHGWPVKIVDGDHLEMLVHPDRVGRAIIDLLESACGGDRPAP